MSALTPRGPRANTPAKLPALQSIRVADPNVRQALQSIQEWVEVRLGARGDRYERAVTFREFDPTVEELEVRIKALEDALAKLEPTALATVDSTPVVDTLARSDIASLTVRVVLLELTVRTGGGSGTGTVTSVAMTVPAFLSVGGSPITGAGTLAVTLSGTALPVANGGTGITAFGTGIATALGVNVGSAGAPVINGGALGTPSSATLTNATGLPVAGGGTGVATLTAYAPVFGGTTGTGAVQSGTVGTTGQVLTSNGAGVLPTFQAISGTVSDGDKGDITVSAGGATYTIDNDVVSNAKLANMATKTYKGRTSGSTGDPEDVAAATLRVDIGEAVSTLTDGATVSVDASLANNFRVVLGGNRTLANPTNLISGQVINFRIKQDGTGTRTLAYGSKYKFPSGTAPVLTTTASATDFMSCQYDSTDDTLVCVLNKAFA